MSAVLNDRGGQPRITYDTHPDRYVHWRLSFDGPLATLAMDVNEEKGLKPGYKLKLNSYDLGVDIELYDALNRIRFEHPEVRCVVITSAKERMFCSGANIYMLGLSSHAWKVNFCKFTNETRNGIEDSSRNSGLKFLAALNGTVAGGGYELALACDEILMIDDRSSTVSLPEVPLLGVLPGTGGLTRLTDKRKVRRDLADVFCSTSEGVRADRALQWKLVDATARPQQFADTARQRAQALAAQNTRPGTVKGIALTPLARRIDDGGYHYEHVDVAIDRALRTATLAVSAPTNELDVGTWILKTRGDAARVLECDATLARHRDDWLVNETIGLLRRSLARLDVSSRTLFAIIDQESCFAGTLAELAFAADRSYMLQLPEGEPGAPFVTLSAMNLGTLPMVNGLSRLANRFCGNTDAEQRMRALVGKPLDAAAAAEAGLVTYAPDDIDWEGEVRIAIEERASLSPDALTGMEANLRFTGAETMETRIFGRLSAWQNWIFNRPNAVGEKGALKVFGTGSKAKFDWERV